MTDFQIAFRSYWGRRRLGIVLDNGPAKHMGRGLGDLLALYTTWQNATIAFPETDDFLLLGTPALTPEIVVRRDPSLPAPAGPPPAQVGRYARPASDPGLSDAVGDFAVLWDPNGPTPGTYRALLRGRFSVIVAVLAAFLWPQPIWAILVAMIALALAVPALLAARRLRAGMLFRSSLWFAVALAVAAVVLALIGYAESTPSPGTLVAA
jgi:hypothetical protein